MYGMCGILHTEFHKIDRYICCHIQYCRAAQTIINLISQKVCSNFHIIQSEFRSVYFVLFISVYLIRPHLISFVCDPRIFPYYFIRSKLFFFVSFYLFCFVQMQRTLNTPLPPIYYESMRIKMSEINNNTLQGI